MVKKLGLLALVATLWGSPQAVFAQAEKDGIEAEVSDVTIVVNGPSVRVTNASNSVLEIYNLTGVKIASYRIDSADKRISLSLPKGCYILKVDRVVRKISIR